MNAAHSRIPGARASGPRRETGDSLASAALPRVLLIDLGNTRIKWAWLAGDSVQTQGADSEQVSQRGAAGPKLKDAGAAPSGEGLSDLPFLARQEPVAGALACSVAGAERGRKLAELVRERLAVELAFVEAQGTACGITNAYAIPSNLGADRWAAMIGAHALVCQDCCIVDAGSTITMDLLLAGGRHLGGYIAPGREMGLAAMAGGTAELASRLKDRSGAPLNLAPAADSAEAMEAGVLAAQLGMIRTGMRKLAETGEGSPALLLTGGGANALLATSELPGAQWVPDLVLRGLAALALELPARPE